MPCSAGAQVVGDNKHDVEEGMPVLKKTVFGGWLWAAVGSWGPVACWGYLCLQQRPLGCASCASGNWVSSLCKTCMHAGVTVLTLPQIFTRSTSRRLGAERRLLPPHAARPDSSA